MNAIVLDGPSGITGDDIEEMVSNDHFHVSEADALTLYGSTDLPIKRSLGVVGQYATTRKVEVTYPTGETRSYTVVGGARKHSQGEFTKSNYARLFDIPVYACPARRQSGDLAGARTVTVKGPCGSVEIPIIIAADHAHSGDPGLVGKTLLIMNPHTGAMSYLPIKAGATSDGRIHVHFDAEHGKRWEHVPTLPEIMGASMRAWFAPVEIGVEMVRWMAGARL